MLKVAVMLVSAIIVLQGCSDSSVKQQRPADVTSSPSGAIVYANDKELGATPLRFMLYDAFPAGWKDATYQAEGVLTVKKDGCKDYTLEVNDYILSKPVHADLKCSEINKTEKSPTAEAAPYGAERRFAELEALYKKGVITKDEYNATRERILNEL